MLHYLNNAGAGLMSDETLNVIMDYYRQERSVGAYQAARDNKERTDAFYLNVVNLINADSVEEVAFVDSASRGWNLVIYGANISSGDTIVTLSTEFGTNLITIFDFAKKVGATVKVIPCDEEGSFDISCLEDILGKATGSKMIAVSQAAAQGSIVNPVAEIGRIAKKYEALYVVDGCQSVGQMPVDVQTINCDAFLTSGRKWLCGPRGTGFLYVRKNANIKSTQLDLASADLVLDDKSNVLDVKVRSDAKKFELWERNIASVLGLSEAIFAMQRIGIEKIALALSDYANRIRAAVISNRKLHLIGRLDSSSGIVGFYADEPSIEDRVQRIFADKELIVSTLSDWDCPLAFPRNGATKIFRLSPHYFTDSKTIQNACNAICMI